MGRVFSDLSKLGGSVHRGRFQFSEEGYKKFWGAVGHFLQAPEIGMKKRIAELATVSQFPADVAQMLERYKIGAEQVDLTWRLIFAEVNLNATSASNYTLRDVQNGVAFRQMAVGEKIDYYSIRGAETAITFDTYGAGLQIPEVWYQDQRWWDIEESIEDYNLAWYKTQADTFFGLLHALTNAVYGTGTGVNIAYDSTGSDQLEKDVNTINNAVVSLLTNLETAGMDVNASTRMVLLCPLQMVSRCQAALDVRRGPLYTGPVVELAEQIQLASTLKLNTAVAWNTSGAGSPTAATVPLGYLTVPGKKCKYLNRQSLAIFPPRFDSEVYATKTEAWGRYGGCANAEQIRRLLPAAAA